MENALRILHLEPSKNDADRVKGALEKASVFCKVTRVESRESYLAAVERGGIDVIFADYALPSFAGIVALEVAQKRCPDAPFIFISGTLGEEIAVEALKRGAADYVLKDGLSRLAGIWGSNRPLLCE